MSIGTYYLGADYDIKNANTLISYSTDDDLCSIRNVRKFGGTHVQLLENLFKYGPNHIHETYNIEPKYIKWVNYRCDKTNDGEKKVNIKKYDPSTDFETIIPDTKYLYQLSENVIPDSKDKLTFSFIASNTPSKWSNIALNSNITYRFDYDYKAIKDKQLLFDMLNDSITKKLRQDADNKESKQIKEYLEKYIPMSYNFEIQESSLTTIDRFCLDLIFNAMRQTVENDLHGKWLIKATLSSLGKHIFGFNTDDLTQDERTFITNNPYGDPRILMNTDLFKKLMIELKDYYSTDKFFNEEKHLLRKWQLAEYVEAIKINRRKVLRMEHDNTREYEILINEVNHSLKLRLYFIVYSKNNKNYIYIYDKYDTTIFDGLTTDEDIYNRDMFISNSSQIMNNYSRDDDYTNMSNETQFYLDTQYPNLKTHIRNIAQVLISNQEIFVGCLSFKNKSKAPKTCFTIMAADIIPTEDGAKLLEMNSMPVLQYTTPDHIYKPIYEIIFENIITEETAQNIVCQDMKEVITPTYNSDDYKENIKKRASVKNILSSLEMFFTKLYYNMDYRGSEITLAKLIYDLNMDMYISIFKEVLGRLYNLPFYSIKINNIINTYNGLVLTYVSILLNDIKFAYNPKIKPLIGLIYQYKNLNEPNFNKIIKILNMPIDEGNQWYNYGGKLTSNLREIKTIKNNIKYSISDIVTQNKLGHKYSSIEKTTRNTSKNILKYVTKHISPINTNTITNDILDAPLVNNIFDNKVRSSDSKEDNKTDSEIIETTVDSYLGEENKLDEKSINIMKKAKSNLDNIIFKNFINEDQSFNLIKLINNIFNETFTKYNEKRNNCVKVIFKGGSMIKFFYNKLKNINDYEKITYFNKYFNTSDIDFDISIDYSKIDSIEYKHLNKINIDINNNSISENEKSIRQNDLKINLEKGKLRVARQTNIPQINKEIKRLEQLNQQLTNSNKSLKEQIIKDTQSSQIERITKEVRLITYLLLNKIRFALMTTFELNYDNLDTTSIEKILRDNIDGTDIEAICFGNISTDQLYNSASSPDLFVNRKGKILKTNITDSLIGVNLTNNNININYDALNYIFSDNEKIPSSILPITHMFSKYDDDIPKEKNEFISIFRMTPCFRIKTNKSWYNLFGNLIDISISVTNKDYIYQTYELTNPTNPLDKINVLSYNIDSMIDNQEFTVKKTLTSSKLIPRVLRLMLLYFIKDLPLINDKYTKVLDYLNNKIKDPKNVRNCNVRTVKTYKILSIMPFFDTENIINEIKVSDNDKLKTIILIKAFKGLTRLVNDVDGQLDMTKL
jgi:hypothetical protein